MRANFGNTPASLMGPHGGDPHRQHLSVSGWNLDEHMAQGQPNQAAQSSDQVYKDFPGSYI